MNIELLLKAVDRVFAAHRVAPQAVQAELAAIHRDTAAQAQSQAAQHYGLEGVRPGTQTDTRSSSLHVSTYRRKT
mgnify:CR=1 FL=1